MIARGRALLAAIAFVLVAIVVRMPVALADPPQISMRLDSNAVGVGEEVRVTMQVTTDGAQISDPQLTVTRGTFSSLGMNSGPSTSISIVNGRMTQHRGLNVTWAMRAEKVGSYELGPPTVVVDGQRYAAGKVKVTVVAAGQAPRHPQPTDPFGGGGAFNPFDPFRGFFDPFGDQTPQRSQETPTDPKYALDAPRGAVSFLHATIDKTEAVVGEQVTLCVYLYQDMAEREPESSDVHEAAAADFLKHPLFEDDASNRPVANALVGGRPWWVKLVRKSALFPLKTGDLEIGPMSLTLLRMRGGQARRETESLHVHVTAPPIASRPPGYTLGDVGNFSLSADVTPREIDREGAIGVTVELSGTGNLPANLTPPVRTGIEWLTPEVHEKMGATASDRFGGKRTFSFVVRLHKEGNVDLGSLTLPFWNPDTKTYGVARAALGTIHVRPGAAPATTDTVFDPLPQLPVVRTTRAGAPPLRMHLPDSPSFWLGLGGAPLAYVVVAGAWAASQTVRRRRADRKASPETELKERIVLADTACKNGDAKAAYAAITRALQSATIARAGVNVRDAQASHIGPRLEAQGVNAAAASRLEFLLRTCETARFSPTTDGESEPGVLWKEAKEVIGALASRDPGAPPHEAEEAQRRVP